MRSGAGTEDRQPDRSKDEEKGGQLDGAGFVVPAGPPAMAAQRSALLSQAKILTHDDAAQKARGREASAWLGEHDGSQRSSEVPRSSQENGAKLHRAFHAS